MQVPVGRLRCVDYDVRKCRLRSDDASVIKRVRRFRLNATDNFT